MKSLPSLARLSLSELIALSRQATAPATIEQTFQPRGGDMPKTDRHEPLHWRTTCPSPYATPEEKWPPCGLDCEARGMCERERDERNEELARRERAAGVATADQTEASK